MKHFLVTLSLLFLIFTLSGFSCSDDGKVPGLEIRNPSDFVLGVDVDTETNPIKLELRWTFEEDTNLSYLSQVDRYWVVLRPKDPTVNSSFWISSISASAASRRSQDITLGYLTAVIGGSLHGLPIINGNRFGVYTRADGTVGYSRPFITDGPAGSILYVPPGHTDPAAYTLDVYAVSGSDVSVPDSVLVLCGLRTAKQFSGANFREILYQPHVGMSVTPTDAGRDAHYMQQHPETGIFRRLLEAFNASGGVVTEDVLPLLSESAELLSERLDADNTGFVIQSDSVSLNLPYDGELSRTEAGSIPYSSPLLP